MKKIFLTLPITVLVVLATSCSELLTFVDSAVGSFHNNLSSDVYDHTYTEAWLSGTTGGRVLGASGLALGMVDAFTTKDLSPYKDVLKQGTVAFNEEEGYKTETGSIIGAVATVGGEVIKRYEVKQFQEKVSRLREQYSNEMERNNVEDDCVKDASYEYDINDVDLTIKKKDLAEKRKAYEECKKNKYENELAEAWKQCGLIGKNYDELKAKYDSLPLHEQTRIYLEIMNMHRENYNAAHRIESLEESSDFFSEEERTFEKIEALSVNDSPIEDSRNSQTFMFLKEPPVVEQESVTDAATIIPFVRECGVSGYPFNGIELGRKSHEGLDKLYNILTKHVDLHIKITGHTCNVGSDAVNFRVGLERARRWKEYLVGKGINADRILLDSKGATQPVVANTSSETREKNRRVEIDVLNPEEEEDIRMQVNRLVQFYSSPRTFRVQIMATSVPIKDYDSVFIMKYNIYEPMEEEVGYVGGKKVYRYVSSKEVRSWKEAMRLRDEFAERGFNVWIVEYRGGSRLL